MGKNLLGHGLVLGVGLGLGGQELARSWVGARSRARWARTC